LQCSSAITPGITIGHTDGPFKFFSCMDYGVV
jgi:hypothetical protein